jgi:hypothetical protein
MRIFDKSLKTIIAVCFIPVVVAATQAFFKSLDTIGVFNFDLYRLIAGFFAYPIFHIVFFKPMYIYTIGHELIHVLATWICGGQITSFHITPEGGSVTTTKTNAFIRLSPYFVPIHAIVLFLLYQGISHIFDVSRFADEFVFLLGFTISFHLFMTIDVMKMRQLDIVKTGHLFSVLFIYIANIFVLVVVLGLVFRDISVVSFIKKTCVLSKEIYIDIFAALLSSKR